MNFQKKILSLRGEEMPKTYPLQKELDRLPKLENGMPDRDKLEKETLGNIILVCLANYVTRENNGTEGFYANAIAQIVLANDAKSEFKKKFLDFLIEMLDDSVLRREKFKDDLGREKEEVKGLYLSWAIFQCKEELGVKLIERVKERENPNG